MKARLLLFLPLGLFLAVAAWSVHVPSCGSEHEVPEKYRPIVSKGLEYLAQKQHKDGHWEGDDGKHPVAMTALVGMAFLMQCEERPDGIATLAPVGEKKTGKYLANVEKAIDWLLARCRRDGLIYSEHPSETDCYMYGHGLAMQFLAWASVCDINDEPRETIEKALPRAITCTASAQTSRGGWYRTSRTEGHDLDEPLATAIQMLAARAMIPVVRHEFLFKAAATTNGLISPRDPPARTNASHAGKLTETAAALACQLSPRELPRDWLEYCRNELRFDRDELAHSYYALAIYCQKDRDNGESWTRYSQDLFNHLQRTQKLDGSWPASEGIFTGPVFATAVWCTVLQLDRNSHILAPRAEKQSK